MATLNQVSTGSGGTWSTNIVGLDTDSTTSSRPTTASTSSMTSNPYLLFDCSDSIPAGAVVSAISASIKCRAYSTSTTYRCYYQLYNGTTSISSSAYTSATSSSNIVTINATSIPSSYNNLRIYFRSGSTSSGSRPYVYGAHVTITYTVPPVSITETITGNGIVVPSDVTEAVIGSDLKFTLVPNAGASIVSVTDNGTNVTTRIVDETRTVIDVPERSIADSDFTIAQRGTASYGFTKQTAALTYTSTMSGNSVRAGTTRFTTNFTQPVEVTLTMKWNTQNTSDYVYVGNFDTALPTSTTQPSASQYQFRHAGSTTSFVYAMTIPAGAHYFDMYNYHARSNSSRACTVVFSGIVPAVTHEEPTGNKMYELTNISTNHELVFTFSTAEVDEMFVKVNGAWKKCIVYKKVNGVWVEQTDLANLFDENTNYVKAN